MGNPKYMVIVGRGDIETEGNSKDVMITICEAQRKPAHVETADGEIVYRNRAQVEVDMEGCTSELEILLAAASSIHIC